MKNKIFDSIMRRSKTQTKKPKNQKTKKRFRRRNLRKIVGGAQKNNCKDCRDKYNKLDTCGWSEHVGDYVCSLCGKSDCVRE